MEGSTVGISVYCIGFSLFPAIEIKYSMLEMLQYDDHRSQAFGAILGVQCSSIDDIIGKTDLDHGDS